MAAGLSQKDIAPEVGLIAIEVGDRILELAFRGRRRADRRIIVEGAEMLIGYLERVVGQAGR